LHCTQGAGRPRRVASIGTRYDEALDALVAALDPRVASAPDRLTSSCLLYATLVSADLDSATYSAESQVSNRRPVTPIKDGSRRLRWPVGANAQAGPPRELFGRFGHERA
jgi:hypothetical protein